MEDEKKIKKLLHLLEHTEEHFEIIINLMKELNLNAEGYEKLYDTLKNENEKLKKELSN
ncbi:hypothetical protein [Methanotorris igneus]|uniref:Uncharacterized protein n=1 Tax=Methanotorris igneus (strain DSM 5666 / JCM 11834 / Kol 5) TaxID=880724 RepID=F6BCM4_METIK|nr:hypothetical protein [Methanotorris igneus]AEF96235.1 hypothetical protein Metig_0685 [Methanotorris igneus Kol 5]